jgi:CubicO group peptidase (beta-lactamase class C family)
MSRQLDNTATENSYLDPMNLCRLLAFIVEDDVRSLVFKPKAWQIVAGGRSDSGDLRRRRESTAPRRRCQSAGSWSQCASKTERRLLTKPINSSPSLCSVFIAVVLFATFQLPASQINAAPTIPPLSAELILHRALDARGGEAAAAQIRSFHLAGSADFAGGARCDYEFLGARPNKSRETFDVGGGNRYEYAFDGKMAWISLPHTTPETQSGDNFDNSKDDASFFAWYDDPRSYRSVTYEGETSFEGTKCYQLKVITISGHEQIHYYNASNYLLFATVEGIATEAGPESCTTLFQQYGKFSGFLFPTRLRCRTEESEWLIRFNSVQTLSVDDSAFKMNQVSATTNEIPATLSDAEIKTLLKDCIDGDKLGVGLVVGMVDSNGTRVMSYGKVDNGSTNQEINGDTLFEIGSITKVFTRLLLYDMISRGEMHMDDPVQNYLPASVRMPTWHGKQITLWDLVTHTSGLPREMNRPCNVEQLYAFLASLKLRREPGEQFEYSNIGFGLLGHVIALKAGQDYETLVRERICRPLHMDSTAITLTPALKARRAVGHTPANRSASYIGLQGLPGYGALFSTANDMLKLASAKQGFTPCQQMLFVKRAANHNGGTYGFSTMLAFEFKPRRALVVLSNCRGDDLMDHFYALLKNQSPKPPHTVPLSADSCDQFVGQYHAKDNRIMAVRHEGNRLLLQEFGKPSCELFPLSQTNFSNQLFDCRASFAGKDSKGRAQELLLGDASNPSWRGPRIPGQVLPPSPTHLTKNDCLPRKDSDLQGIWTATLRPWYWPFYAVHVKIRVAEPSPRAFRAELDSPDLDAENLPLAIIYNPPRVDVFGFSGEGSFEGTVNAAHTKVPGHWNVGGHTVAVTFRRIKL